MSENLQWIFSGIGVEILKIVVTLIVPQGCSYSEDAINICIRNV